MHSQPHVAILGLNFPPERTGIAPYTGSLASGLGDKGFRVTAHVAHPHYPEWKIERTYGQWSRVDQVNGVDTYRRLHYVPRSPRGLRRLLSETTFGLRLVLARWDNPDVVIVVSPSLFASAMAVCRLRLGRRRPFSIVWLQDIYTLGLTETGQGGGLAAKITRLVEKQTLDRADRIVVIHERFADYLAREFAINARKIDVVRNWTHLAATRAIDSNEARTTLKWPENVVLAVHTGNMGVKQGLQNVIDAARIAEERSSNVHFVLVGDGSEKQTLLQSAQGVSHVTFLPPLGDREYKLALAAADVLIVNELPGVSGMAVPSKLTSYFDAGRPVVAATDIAGITAKEVANSHAGLVVPAGSPGALLEAVESIASDRDAAARYGENGRRFREAELAQDAAIEKWAQIVISYRNNSV